MQDGKFHPHTAYNKGIRKSRDQKVKLIGIRLKKTVQTKTFPAKSDLLKKIFPKGIPASKFSTGFNFEKQTSFPIPAIKELEFPEEHRTFLTKDGYFLDAGGVTDDGFLVTHGTILEILTGKDADDRRPEQIVSISKELGLVRINIGGTESSINVFDKVTRGQLRGINKVIKDADDLGIPVEFEIGSFDKRFLMSTKVEDLPELNNKKEFFAELRKLGWLPT